MNVLRLVILGFALQIAPGDLRLPNGSAGGPVQVTGTGTSTSAFRIILRNSAAQTVQKMSNTTIVSRKLPVSGPVVIAPSDPPAVRQGTTFQFTANAEGTWSCSGTDSTGAATSCKGGINPLTGLYTAPATVIAHQSVGGYQLLPNNHIFNTRIDSLPVSAKSAAWIAGAGTVNLSYEGGFPVNYVNGSTPIQSVVFHYTPGNNGRFQIPAYPDVKIEGGWLTRSNGNIDHHLVTVDTTNGTFQEMYQFHDVGQNRACPTCVSQGGIRYSNSTYDLPNVQGGATDAAGMYLMPLTLHPQELQQAVATGGTIKHALRMTLQNGYILGTGGVRHIWPATAEALSGGGVVPYGARFRLKASFNISRFSTIAQILLTQLKQYGLILADGGTGWAVSGPDPGKIPKAYADAFTEIRNAAIAPSNFEAVDESGLMISPTSGETTSNRETVTFTRSSDFAKASVDVVLAGVTVNLPDDTLYIQAGTAAQQLTAFVAGAASTSVTWTMAPTVGSLTPSGIYTAPATSSTLQLTTVTATSVDDVHTSAAMTIVIYPNGTISLAPAQPVDYRDAHGNLWLHGPAGDGGWGYDNGGPWPSLPDITLYKIPIYGSTSGVDLRFDILMPNGSYQITGKFAETQGNVPGYKLFSLESQGKIIFPNVDVYVSSGGHNMPIDFTLPALVTDGKLSFVIRALPAINSNVDISALQIAPITSH